MIRRSCADDRARKWLGNCRKRTFLDGSVWEEILLELSHSKFGWMPTWNKPLLIWGNTSQTNEHANKDMPIDVLVLTLCSAHDLAWKLSFIAAGGGELGNTKLRCTRSEWASWTAAGRRRGTRSPFETENM